MKKLYILSVFIVFIVASKAQKVNYSPAYFGPNANPVPEFTDATIPAKTSLGLAEDFFFGFGDNTVSAKLTIEVPLLPEYVSLKVWLNTLEFYRVSEEVRAKRNMPNGNLSGKANGDFYVQTRIRIFKEKTIVPSVILNSTLKTASGTNFEERRYFDTPGYYFDVEFGKSIHTQNKLVSEIRGVANLGFLCWETTNSTQNDAPMYGGKLILSNKYIDFENSLSGYWGWMRNGDNPLIYSSKIGYKTNHVNFHLMYQYGINDFPYHRIQAGFSIGLQKLTPAVQ